MSYLIDGGMMGGDEWCDDCHHAYCECGYADGELDDWGCCLGDACLMPSYDHRASECYNVEMAEAWADEATQNYYEITTAEVISIKQKN